MPPTEESLKSEQNESAKDKSDQVNNPPPDNKAIIAPATSWHIKYMIFTAFLSTFLTLILLACAFIYFYDYIVLKVKSNDKVDKPEAVVHVGRGWLGVFIEDVTPDLAQYYGLKELRGVLIITVYQDSPAAEAGFQAGDIILNFDGKDIKYTQDLPCFVAGTEVGKEVNVVVWRDKKETTIKVKVGLLPDFVQSIPGSGGSAADIGLQVIELTPGIAGHLRVSYPLEGVLVLNVTENSPAKEAGFKPKDIILRLDNYKVSSLSDFLNAFNMHIKGVPYLFMIKRGDANIFLSFSDNFSY
ncbi:MAG: PDZ domain-containing protein [Clostridiales Family XIII bacterium]|jgi:serine protease Do|nr:PDZ domain-containing protein [Clostridiales Family XIII bacterium]